MKKNKMGKTLKAIVTSRDTDNNLTLTPMQRTVLFKQGRVHLERKIAPVSKSCPSPVMLMAKEWKERSLMPIIKLLLPEGSIRKILEQNIQKVFPTALALEMISRMPATAAQICQFYDASDCQNWLKQFANITKDSTQQDCFAACSNCENFNSGAVDQCSTILYSCLQAIPSGGSSSADNKLWIIGVVIGCAALIGVVAVWKSWDKIKRRVEPLLAPEGRALIDRPEGAPLRLPRQELLRDEHGVATGAEINRESVLDMR